MNPTDDSASAPISSPLSADPANDKPIGAPVRSFIMKRWYSSILFIVAAWFLSACTNPVVLITYQPLATFNAYGERGDLHITGGIAIDPNEKHGYINGEAWTLYMLRGFKNTDKNAIQFTFDITKIKQIELDGDLENFITEKYPYLIPSGYLFKVTAPATVEPPMGVGRLFLARKDNVSPAEAFPYLSYQSPTGVAVLMKPLNSKTPPPSIELFDHIEMTKMYNKMLDWSKQYDIGGECVAGPPVPGVPKC